MRLERDMNSKYELAILVQYFIPVYFVGGKSGRNGFPLTYEIGYKIVEYAIRGILVEWICEKSL